MSYQISQYTRLKAKALGVEVRPSVRGRYKIDVLSPEGRLITSIGDRRYQDYPSLLAIYGKSIADAKRKAYLSRSNSYKTDRGRYSRLLLW